MNVSLLGLEIAVLVLALAVLLLDLWVPGMRRREVGWAAAAILLVILGFSFILDGTEVRFAFHESYVMDGLALFFKRLFLGAGVLVLILAAECSDRIEAGLSEFFSLTLFALAGMMFAASAHDLSMLFVSVELMAVTFYVLTSFQRNRLVSLEAGVKYLILGAVSSAFLVYGIAFIYGVTGTLNFGDLSRLSGAYAGRPLYLVGMLLLLTGLGFKIAVVPMQVWVPDVYQGAPTPVTAFLAIGSKAAGFVLLLRVFFGVATEVVQGWEKLLVVLAALTILYGNLCAIPQRNLKRLLGYSSIANAGYLMLGVAALTQSGSSAVLFYLVGYLFAVLAAFTVLALAIRPTDGEDIAALAGLGQRSPWLAGTMTLAMVSLAGVPPLVGFFGKFLLLKAVAKRAAEWQGYYWLLAVAIVGVVVSLWYYFGVIRAMYWSKAPPHLSPIPVSLPARISLGICLAGLLYFGILPGAALEWANTAARFLRF